MDGRYVFETTSPNSTARVPMGFDCEQYIENDLYEIIKELKEFQSLLLQEGFLFRKVLLPQKFQKTEKV